MHQLDPPLQSTSSSLLLQGCPDRERSIVILMDEMHIRQDIVHDPVSGKQKNWIKHNILSDVHLVHEDDKTIHPRGPLHLFLLRSSAPAENCQKCLVQRRKTSLGRLTVHVLCNGKDVSWSHLVNVHHLNHPKFDTPGLTLLPKLKFAISQATLR